MAYTNYDIRSYEKAKELLDSRGGRESLKVGLNTKLYKRPDGVSYGEHIKSHLEESYFVPSLLMNAADAMGVSQAAKWTLASTWNPTAVDKGKNEWYQGIGWKQLEKALYRYILRETGQAY